MLKRDSKVDIISLKQCVTIGNVCHGWEWRHLSSSICIVTFSQTLMSPFDEFTMSVLCVLSVTSTQLHRNTWASFASLSICIQDVQFISLSSSFPPLL